MTKKRISIIAGVILIVLFLFTPSHGWIIFHKPAFKGKVIDAETKQPIEGAVVVAVYGKQACRFPSGASTITINAKEILTNEEGFFKIPSYTTIIDPLSRSVRVSFIIFKPGYGTFPGPGLIVPIDQEVFFSENYGKEREIETWRGSPKEGNGPELYRPKVTFGLVELPKLKTREERKQAWMGADIFDYEIKANDLPILFKLIREGREVGF